MGLFGFGAKKQNFLGVDIGGGGIKLTELQSEKNRARLFTYGFNERGVDEGPANLIDSPAETAALLRAIAKKARVSTMKVVAGLPISSVFSSVISVPKGNEKELKDSILYQARKLIPVPLEEMSTDFKIISPTPSKEVAKPAGKDAVGAKAEGKTVQVLLMAASHALGKKYVDVFKAAGLQLDSLETEALALIRSLVGKDRATTMIVDVGALRTNVIVVDNGVPFVTRSLDMGGVTLTKAMAKTLSLDLKSAEAMKCDIKSVSSIYPGDGLPKIFETTIAPLITELQYSMSLYIGQAEGMPGAGKQVEKIILTGGSAGLPALAPHIASRLGIKTYVGDPWARVVCPDGLRTALEEIGPRFAVSVGLAMRDIE
ncbi:MAG: hypothetical protein RLZZ324_670 [Candidatus Parcubacteria bacterium]|jgi:type IV pilus assembly protein PilM